MTDAELLQRFSPYLQYDSLESFRADSAAELPEGYFDDGTTWSYTNSLKRKDGSVVAAANPRPGQTKLDLTFLGATRYRNGVSVRRTDCVDAAGRRYVADARRMHADPRFADRIYGHVAREANGTRWAQYWFFYYYNDKNFLGIGLHEGDWEMIQLRIDSSDAPHRGDVRAALDGRGLQLVRAPATIVPRRARPGGVRRPRLARVLRFPG